MYHGEKLTDWTQISARDGKPSFLENESSHCFCPNHPGFQRSYLDYIKRHLEAVPIDALISEDLQFVPDEYACACTHCRTRFREESGMELPAADDLSFWENRGNAGFLAWLQARYRWQAEHFQRLRELLPKEVLLLASAKSCIDPKLVTVASSPQLLTGYLDAVLHEIPSGIRPGADDEEMFSELAAFASLARDQQKPLLAHCHIDRPENVASWLHFLAQHHARPWISRQTGTGDFVIEEQLLEGGFHFERGKKQTLPEPIQTIAFSHSFRDSLERDEAEVYVETYRQLSTELLLRGSDPHLLFDNMWDSASPKNWECLWILDSRGLSEDQAKTVLSWQEQGLAVGVA